MAFITPDTLRILGTWGGGHLFVLKGEALVLQHPLPYWGMVYSDSTLLYTMDSTDHVTAYDGWGKPLWTRPYIEPIRPIETTRYHDHLLVYGASHWMRRLSDGKPLYTRTQPGYGPFPTLDGQWAVLEPRSNQVPGGEATFYYEVVRIDSTGGRTPLLDRTNFGGYQRIRFLHNDTISLVYSSVHTIDPIIRVWWVNRRTWRAKHRLVIPLDGDHYVYAAVGQNTEVYAQPFNDQYYLHGKRSNLFVWIDSTGFYRFPVAEPIHAIWPASDSTLYYIAGRQLVEANPYMRTQEVRYEHTHDLIAGTNNTEHFYFIEKEYDGPNVYHRLCRVPLPN